MNTRKPFDLDLTQRTKHQGLIPFITTVYVAIN